MVAPQSQQYVYYECIRYHVFTCIRIGIFGENRCFFEESSLPCIYPSPQDHTRPVLPCAVSAHLKRRLRAALYAVVRAVEMPLAGAAGLDAHSDQNILAGTRCTFEPRACVEVAAACRKGKRADS